MRVLNKPQKLKAGDSIAAVSLSWGGPSAFPYRYHVGKKQLEDAFDITVVEMPHTLTDAQWLRENPRARADDLMQAFDNPDIDGIIATIGGDDSIRILPLLDLSVITNNPKVLLGYSDTTVAHFACNKAGIVSFYGPSIMAGFAENGGLFPYMVKSLKRTLFCSETIGKIEPNHNGWTDEFFDWKEESFQKKKRNLNEPVEWKFLQGTGIHTGRLMGGCFEVLDWLRGTKIWPDIDVWKEAVLFIETSEEAPTPLEIKRGFRSLAALGVLKRIKGILFGRPGGHVPVSKYQEYEDALIDIVTGEEGLSDIPIVTRMDFGHTDPMIVLPYGIECMINCNSQEITLLENAVIDKK
jgi:muramoyltetrapeptide carboxypeptidase LdcA involved in peptidoglycan recycling